MLVVIILIIYMKITMTTLTGIIVLVVVLVISQTNFVDLVGIRVLLAVLASLNVWKAVTVVLISVKSVGS